MFSIWGGGCVMTPEKIQAILDSTYEWWSDIYVLILDVL